MSKNIVTLKELVLLATIVLATLGAVRLMSFIACIVTGVI